jgi:hypothetical protein
MKFKSLLVSPDKIPTRTIEDYLSILALFGLKEKIIKQKNLQKSINKLQLNSLIDFHNFLSIFFTQTIFIVSTVQ